MLCTLPSSLAATKAFHASSRFFLPDNGLWMSIKSMYSGYMRKRLAALQDRYSQPEVHT